MVFWSQTRSYVWYDHCQSLAQRTKTTNAEQKMDYPEIRHMAGGKTAECTTGDWLILKVLEALSPKVKFLLSQTAKYCNVLDESPLQ